MLLLFLLLLAVVAVFVVAAAAIAVVALYMCTSFYDVCWSCGERKKEENTEHDNNEENR